MQAQFKIYEIKSRGQDSSPSYIGMELLQLDKRTTLKDTNPEMEGRNIEERATNNLILFNI